MKKVATNTIDAGLLAKMFLAGAKNLEVKKEWINELNVFPVPEVTPALFFPSSFVALPRRSATIKS